MSQGAVSFLYTGDANTGDITIRYIRTCNLLTCRCQTVTITTCVWIEQSAGRQTLSGSIRKAHQRSSTDRVSVIHFYRFPIARRPAGGSVIIRPPQYTLS